MARMASGRSMSPRRQARSQAPSRRRSTSPRPDSARGTGCSPPRTAPRRRGSGSRGSSSRPDTLPGTRCCTAATRRRRAERGIPGRGRWPSGSCLSLGARGRGAERRIGVALTVRNLLTRLIGAAKQEGMSSRVTGPTADASSSPPRPAPARSTGVRCSGGSEPRGTGRLTVVSLRSWPWLWSWPSSLALPLLKSSGPDLQPRVRYA